MRFQVIFKTSLKASVSFDAIFWSALGLYLLKEHTDWCLAQMSIRHLMFCSCQILIYSLCDLWLVRFSLSSLYHFILFLFFFFSFIFISWTLITLQYCSGFCHTLTWISHGFTCVPHPDPPSFLPPHPIPLGLPSAPALSTCLMHPIWAGDLFNWRIIAL